MPKKKVKKYNGGSWTEARFNNFIRGILRHASMKWPPKNNVKKKARVSWGKYRCAGCNKIVPPTKNKKHNVFIDHIKPVVDPKKGFTTWDKFIKNLFCEESNLQLLCKECHDLKTEKEKAIARERKQV